MKNITNKAQRDLIRVYESIAHLLPPTSPETWEAWVRLGRHEKQKFNK